MATVGARSYSRMIGGGEKIGPLFPTHPEKMERKKWNKPAVVVLLVNRPFVAQVPAEDEPKCAQASNTKRGVNKRSRLLQGRSLRGRDT